jgi:hypothetical protein
MTEEQELVEGTLPYDLLLKLFMTYLNFYVWSFRITVIDNIRTNYSYTQHSV